MPTSAQGYNMLITPYYAALLALIFVALSFRVIRIRQQLKVSLGDGKDKQLKRAIRVHGNFAEYVPLTLMMIYFVEIQSHNALLIHWLCTVFILARLSHIYGVSQLKENLMFRVFGLFITGSVICTAAIVILMT
jgi:uncharacterized membrane protein YecN with MAPEG domain